MIYVFFILIAGIILTRLASSQGNKPPRGSNKFRNRFDR